MGCSVPWGYHEYRGGFLEYHGGVQYHGGYHDTCGGYQEYRGGCSVPLGEKSFVICVPNGTEHPHGTHDIPTCIMISPTVLKFQRMVLKIAPTVFMISSMVLNTTTVLKISPTFIMISTMVLKISPMVLNTPTVLSTPTVLHTHYTG